MQNKYSSLLLLIGVSMLMVSCKKDYQKMSVEFIHNLPDTCVFLTQVDNDAEHLVYYKGSNCNQFYCYTAETDKVEEIKCPKVEEYYGLPQNIGAGKENIIIGYMMDDSQGEATIDNNASVQIYNLKTRSFKEFTTCNTIEFDYGKNQLLCQTFDTNKYGDGSRIDEIYDFDGKMLSNNEVEIADFEEVPSGTLAAREQEALEQERIEQQQSVGNYNRPARTLYYCELCGEEYTNVQDLLNNGCLRNKMGSTLGHHKLYEGSIKSVYTCRYCGKEYSSIKDMVFNSCLRRGGGERHVPAL